MIYVFILLTTFTLVLIFALIVQARRKLTIAHAKQLGLSLYRQLRILLECVPQHRGMSNAILQGDNSFNTKITQVESRIDKALQTLLDKTELAKTWGLGKRLAQVNSRWRSLLGEYRRYNVAENFAIHTALISEILDMLVDLAEESALLCKDEDNYHMFRVAFVDMPLTTELLGQTRGLGTGVAAKNKRSTTDKIKLQYRLDKAKQVFSSISTALTQVSTSQIAYKSQVGSLLETSRLHTNEFLSLLEHKILLADQIELTADDYYASGTKALDANFALLDKIGASLSENSSLELQQAQRKQVRAYALTVGGMLLCWACYQVLL